MRQMEVMQNRNRRVLTRATLAMAFLVVTGCASASLQVSQHVSDSVIFDRLFVVVGQGPQSGDDAEAMAAAMEKACAGHVSSVDTAILTGRELDPGKLRRTITALGAQAVLLLKPTGGTLNEYGGTLAITYAVSLKDRKSGHVIWHARASNTGGSIMSGRRNSLTAEAIVAELVKEGVLRGTVAK